MAPLATGSVVERRSARGLTFALRFRAYGRREFITLGTPQQGWTLKKAEAELANVLADVRRGLWRPPGPEPESTAAPDPSFHEFASEWWEAKKAELRPNTVAAYERELTLHLLPFFKKHRLSQITIQEVDRYRAFKLREGALTAPTINKTLTRLGQILEDAVEYELIPRNPAKGKRRRLKTTRNTRSYLDRAAHIEALLDAAGRLDERAPRHKRHVGRRAIVATLTFGGLRIGELCALRWRDVDLAAGRITVGESKTDAGIRQVRMLPILRNELTTWKAKASRVHPCDFVFATSTGGRPLKDNLRARVIGPTIREANVALEAAGETPLPEKLTPHGLRHTCASILVALGRDPRYVMGQLGHTDPAFTLRLYSHVMQQDDGEREALRTLADWARLGTTRKIRPKRARRAASARNAKPLH